MDTDTVREAALTDYAVDERNVNLGTPEGEEAHRESIQHNGLGRSILATRDRVIMGGNKTWERAGELGRAPADGVATRSVHVVRATGLPAG